MALLGFMRRLLNRFREHTRKGVFHWIAYQIVVRAYNGLSPGGVLQRSFRRRPFYNHFQVKLCFFQRKQEDWDGSIQI